LGDRCKGSFEVGFASGIQDGNGRVCCPRCQRRRCAGGGNHSDLAADQVGQQTRQLIQSTVRPAKFDRDVLALDVARFGQALPEPMHKGRVQVCRGAVEKADHRHRPLLRARRERPRRCRAAQKRDELAPLHSITSSARANGVSPSFRIEI